MVEALARPALPGPEPFHRDGVVAGKPRRNHAPNVDRVGVVVDHEGRAAAAHAPGRARAARARSRARRSRPSGRARRRRDASGRGSDWAAPCEDLHVRPDRPYAAGRARRSGGCGSTPTTAPRARRTAAGGSRCRSRRRARRCPAQSCRRAIAASITPSGSTRGSRARRRRGCVPDVRARDDAVVAGPFTARARSRRLAACSASQGGRVHQQGQQRAVRRGVRGRP